MERLGGTLTSLMIVWFTWIDDFVIWCSSVAVSLLVSELQDKLKKTIKQAKIMKRYFIKVNTSNFSECSKITSIF